MAKFCFKNVNRNFANTCVLKVGLGSQLDDVIGKEKRTYFCCEISGFDCIIKREVELTQTLKCKKQELEHMKQFTEQK